MDALGPTAFRRGGVGGISDRQTTSQAPVLGPMIPVRPGSDEPRFRDWRFQLEFTIQLLRPDEAREASKAEGQTAREQGAPTRPPPDPGDGDGSPEPRPPTAQAPDLQEVPL